MTINRSNIEMAQLKLIKSVFAVNVDHQPTEARISIGVSLKNNGEFLDDGRRAHFIQRFKTGDPETAPFFLDVEFGALFFLDPPPLPLEWPHYVRQVLPQIVFPYLREYVAETTRRGGFTPLIINQSIFGDDAEANPNNDSQKWIH
ncbi:MAG: protein-export chaperone SecB [Candidatus Adiutrix sp.]|jgi:preprotein translocase subunit SecB|nr:protein-export chaperone SecB [Candidatus Adiutrix sp.]